MIRLNERHLRHVLQQWIVHYDQGRPHGSRAICRDIQEYPARVLATDTQGASIKSAVNPDQVLSVPFTQAEPLVPNNDLEATEVAEVG
jgi:hypothetical protein